MKFLSFAAMAMMASGAVAHSWLECVDTVVKNKDAAKKNPSLTVDQTCKGFPRNKVNNGDWISESSNYAYGFSTEYACREGQRQPGQTASGAPMATATPGQKLLMRYWGNGHSRWDIGSPNHRDPGLVRLYWAGKKETEIEKLADLTEKYWVPGTQQNFSADAVTELTDGNTHMNEKANYMTFTVPEKIENGRHMMVWGWAWKAGLNDAPAKADDYNAHWDLAWGTCFDLVIKDSKFSGTSPVIKGNQKGYTETSSASSTCAKTCLKGGQASAKCDGSKEECPPCWYLQDGNINCYGYKSGTTCPWEGAQVCSGKSKRELLHSHSRKHKRNM